MSPQLAWTLHVVVQPPEPVFPRFLSLAPPCSWSFPRPQTKLHPPENASNFPCLKVLLCGLGRLEGRDRVSLAFVPARPTPALLSGSQEMIAQGQKEDRQGVRSFSVPGYGRSTVMGLLNRDDFYWFLSLGSSDFIRHPELALGEALARFTALLVQTASEERSSPGKDAGPG